MKKAEAISILATSVRPREAKDRARYDKAVKMAIEALNCSEFPNNSDTISRQAAIDTDGLDEEIRCEMCKNPMHTDRGCDGNCRYDEKLYKKIIQLLNKRITPLPSAQPEIIRCTECKHYREYDSEYVENAVVVQCMADRYPISETIPDGWFCAGAERKDDE